jgi:tetratricopeptide (TPR) repeat protein
MLSRKRNLLTVMFFLFSAFLVTPALCQSTEQVQVGPPPMHRAEPPSAGASAEELERRGDELRTEKNYLDAIDYYEAAAKKAPASASLLNKVGICHLMLQRLKEARKSFERSIKADKNYADAYNNLGVVFYAQRDYGKAIRRYEKAVALNSDAASYYSNLGAAYFSRKQFDKAAVSYAKALELDPDVFERISRAGVQAQLPSPEDRARYDYVLAKLYAKNGSTERSLHYLRKAMEEGYKDIKDVYKDAEFAELRKDPRFSELMAAKPATLPE